MPIPQLNTRLAGFSHFQPNSKAELVAQVSQLCKSRVLEQPFEGEEGLAIDPLDRLPLCKTKAFPVGFLGQETSRVTQFTEA
jgi:hypothetical protein